MRILTYLFIHSDRRTNRRNKNSCPLWAKPDAKTNSDLHVQNEKRRQQKCDIQVEAVNITVS